MQPDKRRHFLRETSGIRHNLFTTVTAPELWQKAATLAVSALTTPQSGSAVYALLCFVLERPC
jgi:hypothetical protein